MRFPAKKAAWHAPCSIHLESHTTQPHRRTTMKFETVMLQGFFAACLLICVTTLGAMLA
jgi:hypothetical protein